MKDPRMITEEIVPVLGLFLRSQLDCIAKLFLTSHVGIGSMGGGAPVLDIRIRAIGIEQPKNWMIFQL